NADGVVPARGDDLISGKYPWYRFYETGDGKYLHLGALEWRFWKNFCAAIDRPDWIDKQMSTGAEADAIGEAIAALFKSADRDHWVDTLAPLDTCVAPVWTLEEARDSELFRERDMFVESEHPTDGKIVQAALPLTMTDFTFTARPAPALGADTMDILRAAGYSDGEIDELTTQRVI
ncbi:MAG: CoA transferase, partial [Alphaproteobacteria bacterium]